MLYRIKTVDGAKTKVPLAGSTPAGLPVGSILTTYKKIQPYNYLYCDGSTFDETQYPELYLYLGTNVLPDYRECVPVGAEKNTTDIFDSTETDPSTGLPGTQSHDVFTQGQFKDDQLQDHIHGMSQAFRTSGEGGTGQVDTLPNQSPSNLYTKLVAQSAGARVGNTTRTKEKAVYYYIKAVDGVDIADEDTFLNTVVNTIQGAQSYSTTEQKTGGKWIDGKDIYRKVIQVNGLARSNISTGCPAGTEIIDIRVRVQWTSTSGWDGVYSIGNLQFTNTTNAVYFASLDGTTLINNTTGNYVKDIVIEYVKPN